jgi:hypothetical protein
MTDRRDEVEQRLAELLEERDALHATIENTSERNLLLERKGRESELQVNLQINLFVLFFIGLQFINLSRCYTS